MKEKFYIGSYANCIKACTLEQGDLKLINEIGSLEHPSYLHINQNMLYAVSETQIGGIGIFNILQDGLQKTDFKEVNQPLPCYIATNKTRSNLLIANYGGGSIVMYQLSSKGLIQQENYCIKYVNANMHFADFIDNEIYVVDLGNDSIYVYNLKMELLTTIKLDNKSGPRHLIFSNDQKTIYVVTEMSNEIYVYHKEKNEFKLQQRISTLVDNKVKSYAGAIKISKDNKNIYVTNRGHNSISVFANQEGCLKLIQNISSYGNFPRDIAFNESEEYALVANQKSNNIVVYKRNLKNGTLVKIQSKNVESPSCIVRSGYEI